MLYWGRYAVCGANAYLKGASSTAKGACTPHTTCSRGQRLTDASTTASRSRSILPLYPLDVFCLLQRTAPHTKTRLKPSIVNMNSTLYVCVVSQAAGRCVACGKGEYQDGAGHRAATCKKQPSCSGGQTLVGGTAEKQGACHGYPKNDRGGYCKTACTQYRVHKKLCERDKDVPGFNMAGCMLSALNNKKQSELAYTHNAPPGTACPPVLWCVPATTPAPKTTKSITTPNPEPATTTASTNKGGGTVTPQTTGSCFASTVTFSCDGLQPANGYTDAYCMSACYNSGGYWHEQCSQNGVKFVQSVHNLCDCKCGAKATTTTTTTTGTTTTTITTVSTDTTTVTTTTHTATTTTTASTVTTTTTATTTVAATPAATVDSAVPGTPAPAMKEAPCDLNCINGGTCVLAKADCADADAPFDTPVCDCGLVVGGACFYGARCDAKLVCPGAADTDTCLRFVPQGRGVVSPESVCGVSTNTGGVLAAGACAVPVDDKRAIKAAAEKIAAKASLDMDPSAEKVQKARKEGNDAEGKKKGGAAGAAERGTTPTSGASEGDKGDDDAASTALVVLPIIAVLVLVICLAAVVIKKRKEAEAKEAGEDPVQDPGQDPGQDRRGGEENVYANPAYEGAMASQPNYLAPTSLHGNDYLAPASVGNDYLAPASVANDCGNNYLAPGSTDTMQSHYSDIDPDNSDAVYSGIDDVDGGNQPIQVGVDYASMLDGQYDSATQDQGGALYDHVGGGAEPMYSLSASGDVGDPNYVIATNTGANNTALYDQIASDGAQVGSVTRVNDVGPVVTNARSLPRYSTASATDLYLYATASAADPSLYATASSSTDTDARLYDTASSISFDPGALNPSLAAYATASASDHTIEPAMYATATRRPSTTTATGGGTEVTYDMADTATRADDMPVYDTAGTGIAIMDADAADYREPLTTTPYTNYDQMGPAGEVLATATVSNPHYG